MGNLDLVEAVRKSYPRRSLFEIRCLKNGRAESYWLSPGESDCCLPQRASANGWDVYFGVQPRSAHDGSAKSVRFYIAIILDLDNQQAYDQASSQLVDRGIEPSAIVASGRPGAHHIYLLLDQPTSTDRAKPIARDFCKWLRSDAVFDPARILRMPGTKNQKEGAGVCRVISLNPSVRYTLEQLERVVAEHRIQQPRRVGAAVRRGHSGVYGAHASLLPSHLRHAYLNGGSAGFIALSHRDMAIARALVNGGLSPEDALRCLTESEAGDCIARQYEKGQEIGDSYCRHILEKLGQDAPSTRVVNGAEISTLRVLNSEHRAVPQWRSRSVRIYAEVVSGPMVGSRSWMGWIQPFPRCAPRISERWTALCCAFGLPEGSSSGAVFARIGAVGALRAVLAKREIGFVPVVVMPQNV